MKELDGELKHVYLLSGKENFYIDKAREKILSKLKISRQDVFNIEYKEKMPLSEVINAIDTSPLFSPLNVVVVRNATFFSADGKFDALENSLINILPSSYVIFIVESADKRRKLYKAVSKIGATLEAEQLRSWQIGEWLEEKLKSIGKTMNGAARKFFSERVEMLPEISLWYLENEFDKVAAYVGGREITATDLQRMLAEPPELSNFAIIDAINAKQTDKALLILRNQLRDIYKAPLIISLLVRHIRQLMLAKFHLKRGMKLKELVRPLEVASPFIAQKIGDASRSYTPKILEETFLELADVDFDFKFGRAGTEALERIVVKLCRR